MQEGFNVEALIPHWWTKTIQEFIEADRILHHGPCLLFSATITSDAGGRADSIIYDGFSADAPVKQLLTCIDTDTRQLVFYPPVVFVRGLYIDVGNNVQGISVNYLPIQP